jgi:hypothetical protein
MVDAAPIESKKITEEKRLYSKTVPTIEEALILITSLMKKTDNDQKNNNFLIALSINLRQWQKAETENMFMGHKYAEEFEEPLSE